MGNQNSARGPKTATPDFPVLTARPESHLASLPPVWGDLAAFIFLEMKKEIL